MDAQQRLDGREMTEAEHEEVRLKRIQEKNRRNQRKFRARQRVRLHPHQRLLSQRTLHLPAGQLDSHCWQVLPQPDALPVGD